MTFTVARETTGRKSGKKCVKKGKSNRKKARCTLTKNVTGSFGHRARAGKNTVKFSGRIGNRSLTHGNYRLVAVATDDDKAKSLPVTVKFKIVKR